MKTIAPVFFTVCADEVIGRVVEINVKEYFGKSIRPYIYQIPKIGFDSVIPDALIIDTEGQEIRELISKLQILSCGSFLVLLISERPEELASLIEDVGLSNVMITNHSNFLIQILRLCEALATNCGLEEVVKGHSCSRKKIFEPFDT